jgi:hypothetical protein
MKTEFLAMLGISIAAPASLGVVGLSNTVPNGVKEGCAPCTDAARGSSKNCPRPVKIAPGFYGTSLDDRLTATSETRYYSINARAGQQLILSFAGDGPARGYLFRAGTGRSTTGGIPLPFP